MNPKKYLENRIRGWLPREPSLPSSHSARNGGTLKVRILGGVDAYWAKSKAFRLAALIVFFLILIVSATVVALVFRPYQFLIFAILVIMGVFAYWRRPRKQARYSENPPKSEIVSLKEHVENRVRGWLPQEPSLPNNMKMPSNNHYSFKFTKRFWIGLALSYSLFFLLVVLPFLLGYIDSRILAYGITGIVWSLILMVTVKLLNGADPVLRKRMGYVVLGIWLGFAVGVVVGTLTFGHQIVAAIGSLAYFVLVITALPLSGGLIGYLAGKRKYSNRINDRIEERKI